MNTIRKKPRSLRFTALLPALCAMLFIPGCATTENGKAPPAKGGLTVVEGITVKQLPDGATELEILTDGKAQYISFTSPDKKRLYIDIKASRGPALKDIIKTGDPNILSVSFAEVPGESEIVRLDAELAAGVTASLSHEEKRILATIKSSLSQEGADKDHRLARLLDIDLAAMEKGTTRVTITADREIKYGVERSAERVVRVNLEKTGIEPALKKRISQLPPVPPIESVVTEFSEPSQSLAVSLKLQDIVPYHLTQRQGIIRMDFAPLPGKTKEAADKKKIAESSLTKKTSDNPASPKKAKEPAKDASVIPGLKKGSYVGQKMTMDFVNADVTNVLRLIGEVSNLNIVWGPDVKGVVSMRLKSVPWDQALDLVLANNDLAMRRQGNVIWVTTRTRLAQVEEEEKRKKDEELALKAKEIKEAEEAKKAEPLVTEYLTLDFAKATEIKDHIEKVKSDRGTVSVDERTNTIILRDTAQTIAEAREIAKRFDAPVKQIMIEARIVDASTSFGRDLGVKWGSVDGTTPGIDRRWRKHETQDWGTDPTQYTTYGDMIVGGTFSSNTPTDWVSNLGLSLSRLTNRGLGILTLDASLALAEAENKVKIISAPKVMASNGEKAIISRGDIIYKEIVTADQRDVKELEATLSLAVTPTVSFNDYVTMEVEVTDDKANPDLSGKTEKTIKSKLMVRSGDTLVIGGIYKEDKSESVAGIPWVQDIPVIGWAFKAQKIGMGKTELLVFLTPRVVPSPTVRH